MIILNQLIGLEGKVFANELCDRGSIPGRVIPKTLKMVFDTSLLNSQQYKVRIKLKWCNPGKGEATKLRCSSYWKGSLLVALDYGRHFYFTYLLLLFYYIFTFIPIFSTSANICSSICFSFVFLSSCRAASTVLFDPLSPHVSIVHRFREVFQVTSCIGTDLLYLGSSWSSNLCSSMWRVPQEYITFEFVLTSLAVSRISGSSNLDSFRDGW